MIQYILQKCLLQTVCPLGDGAVWNHFWTLFYLMSSFSYCHPHPRHIRLCSGPVSYIWSTSPSFFSFALISWPICCCQCYSIISIGETIVLIVIFHPASTLHMSLTIFGKGYFFSIMSFYFSTFWSLPIRHVQEMITWCSSSTWFSAASNCSSVGSFVEDLEII